MNSSRTIQPEVEVVCPFCDGKYYAGSGRNGGVPGVVHTMPPCFKFLELDVEVFMKDARLELVRQGLLPPEAKNL